MKCKIFSSLILLLLCASNIFAQLGIKGGVNMANEVISFSQTDIKAGFHSSNLTGYQIGVVYQSVSKKTGLGIEIGTLLSQKGSSFSDTTTTGNTIKQGYKELNYLEFPLNFRYQLTIKLIGIYGFGGIYGGYELSGKTVDESTNLIQNDSHSVFMDNIDYGYNFGAGLELFKKIQLGATWSQGLKNTAIAVTGLPTATSKNRVLSVNLVYLF